MPPLRIPCHFGEWIQGRIGPEGPVALVTMMPRGIWLSATGRPAPRLTCRAIGHGGLEADVLRRFLATLRPPLSRRCLLRLPFPPGLGTGMSTAGLLAVARLAGSRAGPQALARACIAAEGASDPLMHARPDRLLWASREGRVLGRLSAPPLAELLAGFHGPPRPTMAGDEDYDDIADLAREWACAETLSARAAIAGESAARCLARRGPAGDPTPDLARSLGALGWITSHSGAARALVFAPGTLPPRGEAALREAGLRGVRRLVTGGE